MKINCILFPTIVATMVTIPVHAATGSWSYESPKIVSGEFAIRSACIMPAEAKLSKLGMKGTEGMSKESDDWSTSLQTLVEGHLKSAEVDVLPAMTAGSSNASDDEIKQVVLQVEQKYDEISAKINRKPKDIRKSRFTLGDQVALLPCAAKSDVLVFVKGEGRVVTGGKKTMGYLVGGATASGASLVLTMADAKTGEIIAFARLVDAESFGQKFIQDAEKVYGEQLNKQLTKLRVGSHAARK